MATKEELPQRQPRRRGRSLLYIIAAVIGIVVIALAIGLGVGLTRRHQNNDDTDNNNNNNNDAGSSNTSTSPPSSSPTSSPDPNDPMGNVTSAVTPYAHGVWQPPVNATWQIVLLNPLQIDLTSNYITPNVDVWDIDMFTNKPETINHLHQLGKRVICYFSAGSYEPGRPDSNQFLESDKGNVLKGWEEERWLNINSDNVRKIMANRIKLAHQMGCDAIDPDNVDGYSNENIGLPLTKQDSINYIRFLNETAKPYNISVGLKNAAEIIPSVLNYTAFQVNEQCYEKNECQQFSAYINANKPIFHIEYPKGDDTNDDVKVTGDTVDNLCKDQGKTSHTYDYSTVVKNMNLDGWVQFCGGQTATTPCSGGQGYSKNY